MRHFHLTLTATLLLTVAAGCVEQGAAPPASQSTSQPMTSQDQEELLEAVAQAELEASVTEPPAPIISLATPVGWTREEPSSLPPPDDGFTVAYAHESGLGVTLYQYTRGLESISDDPNSSPVQEELQHAKNGIEQAVQLGYWRAAEEVDSGLVPLGQSDQQALWSQYHLTVDEISVVSEIYVWPHANTFLKLRCTWHSDETETSRAALEDLLTALGSSSDDSEHRIK